MLIDTHIHIALNNLYTKKQWQDAGLQQKREWMRETFKRYKEQGIHGLRDGGDNIGASKIAREVAKEEGIIYKSPIYALCKKGLYGSFLGKAIEGLDDFREEFKMLLQNNMDHMKIILTGIVNFNKYGDVGETGFKTEELKYMVECARCHNIPVMAHVNGSEGVGIAIKAGVDTIEHGYLISEAELYGMAENDIVWVPTLAPLGNILVSNDNRFEKEREVIQKVYDDQAENIKRALEIGVKIALGSDAGAYGVGHGGGLVDEMRHFEMLGLNRNYIEEMCFKNGANALNIKIS